MLVSESQILDVLRRQNHWWQSGRVLDDLNLPVKRLAFYEALSLINHPELNRAVILSGVRRVGKTVILHQIAQEKISRGIDPKKILYITFEDLTLAQANLREILSFYERNIAGIDGETLILLDEIHYAADWSRWLMTVIREYPRTRIVATGSAAVLIREPERVESGVGRWTSVHVPTLSFYEYLQLRKSELPILPPEISLSSLFGADARRREDIISVCLPLQREFNRYLLQGGFPAVVSESFTLSFAHRLLREDVIDKALKEDMAHLYGARSLDELDQIFVYLCFNMGAIVEKNTLAKELQIAAATVENHLRRLENAHLIYRLPPYRLGGKKALKPRPKIYVADTTLRNAVILRGEGLFENEAELGSVAEACVFKHLYAFYYPDRPRFGYWRSSKSDKEVDVVAEFPDKKKLAFEIKYRQNPRISSKEGLPELLKEQNPPEMSFLITKNAADYGPLEGGKIFQIPVFLFVYLLGHIEFQKRIRGSL